MTALLRQALAEAQSIRAVAKATDLDHASLVRFLRGDSSLRLDLADRLAGYFGIECCMNPATPGDGGGPQDAGTATGGGQGASERTRRQRGSKHQRQKGQTT